MASKLVQIGPKLDKSGTFSDQISIHFLLALKSDLKKSRFVLIWANFHHSITKADTFGCVLCVGFTQVAAAMVYLSGNKWTHLNLNGSSDWL